VPPFNPFCTQCLIITRNPYQEKMPMQEALQNAALLLRNHLAKSAPGFLLAQVA
jgi:hypothetical protein